MRFHVLAFDYDGTLAQDGRVDATTIQALERARASGRKLAMVTGRELDDLRRVFEREDLFDVIVAENGALLFWPSKREERLLGEAPPQPLVAALKTANVTPLSVGRGIVATWEPNHTAALEAIKALGLEWQVIFNKGAVMVLPPGVNKGTGLAAALTAMRLSPHNVLGVGDAENDHAFLSLCECACAVANALPFVKERADYVSERDHGAGVVDVVTRVLEDEFEVLLETSGRHRISIGATEDGGEVTLPSFGETVLVAGASGSGKSTVTHAFREALEEKGYQYCVIDPEGDYEEAAGVVQFGDPDHRPLAESVLQHLEDPAANAVVNLLGMPLEDRPSYFAKLLPQLLELRSRTGHPHWLIVDEAHHMLPAEWEQTSGVLPDRLGSVLMVTVHPESMSRAVLGKVDTMIGVGPAAHEAIGQLARAIEAAPSGLPEGAARTAIVWRPGAGAEPVRFKPAQPRGEMHRHKRKYAEGDLQDNSFYFQGPEGKLNLRAQNLTLFLQIAEGVDEETWLHHLRRGDYSRWFGECVKDPALAEAAGAIERRHADDADAGRAAIRAAIEERYAGSA